MLRVLFLVITPTDKEISIKTDTTHFFLYKILSLDLKDKEDIFINNIKIKRKDISILDLGYTKILILSGLLLKYSFYRDSLPFKIIGHRGFGMNKYSSILENTVESFNRALEKVNWVEMDVQLDKEGIPVVYHDFIIKKSETPETLEYVLRNIKEGGWINMEIKYPIERDPLYNTINIYDINIDDIYDINNDIDDDISKMVDSILNVISSCNFRRIIFSSFSPTVLLYLKLRLPEAQLFLISDFINEEIISFSKKTNLTGIVFNYQSLNPESVTKIRDSLEVYAYDVYSREEYEKCREMGVKGVITDKIEELINLL